MGTETIARPRPALVVALGLAGLGVLAVVTPTPFRRVQRVTMTSGWI